MQEFLKSAQEEMARLAESEEKAAALPPLPSSTITASTTSTTNEFSTPTRPSSSSTLTATEGKVNEHIGPVQFNMGGIQVDADEMVKHLKEKGEKEKNKGAGGGYGP
ncbi:MAG: hypothetical protein Q9168_008315, partial [Polycauliona sp. 1 TL-2023]